MKAVGIAREYERLRPYLEYQEASKSFESKLVLDNVSFAVTPGEAVCVVGRSWVIKSVCRRIITGFIKPDSGRVIVAGKDITDRSKQQFDRRKTANVRPISNTVNLAVSLTSSLKASLRVPFNVRLPSLRGANFRKA